MNSPVKIDPDDEVEVRIKRSELDLLKKRAEREQTRSGRMSLRVPFPMNKLLDERSRKTRVAKSKIVIDALGKELGVVEGGALE